MNKRVSICKIVLDIRNGLCVLVSDLGVIFLVSVISEMNCVILFDVIIVYF